MGTPPLGGAGGGAPGGAEVTAGGGVGVGPDPVGAPEVGGWRAAPNQKPGERCLLREPGRAPEKRRAWTSPVEAAAAADAAVAGAAAAEAAAAAVVAAAAAAAVAVAGAEAVAGSGAWDHPGPGRAP